MKLNAGRFFHLHEWKHEDYHRTYLLQHNTNPHTNLFNDHCSRATWIPLHSFVFLLNHVSILDSRPLHFTALILPWISGVTFLPLKNQSKPACLFKPIQSSLSNYILHLIKGFPEALRMWFYTFIFTFYHYCSYICQYLPTGTFSRIKLALAFRNIVYRLCCHLSTDLNHQVLPLINILNSVRASHVRGMISMPHHGTLTGHSWIINICITTIHITIPVSQPTNQVGISRDPWNLT